MNSLTEFLKIAGGVLAALTVIHYVVVLLAYVTNKMKPITEAPRLDRPSKRVRIALFMDRDNKLTLSGDNDQMRTMATVIGRFAVHAARQGGDSEAVVNPEDIALAILEVIDRSEKNGISDRTIIQLREDTKAWRLSITPLYPVESK